MKKDILKIIENEKEKSQKKVKSITLKIDEKLVNALNKIAEHNKINKNILIEKILIQADIIEIADEIKPTKFEELKDALLNTKTDNQQKPEENKSKLILNGSSSIPKSSIADDKSL
jgi:hypothetical protein